VTDRRNDKNLAKTKKYLFWAKWLKNDMFLKKMDIFSHMKILYAGRRNSYQYQRSSFLNSRTIAQKVYVKMTNLSTKKRLLKPKIGV